MGETYQQRQEQALLVVRDIGKWLSTKRQALDMSMPKHLGLTAERHLQLTVMAMRKKPTAWTRVNRDSLYNAVQLTAELGLDPAWGPLGEVALVPFGDEVQVIPGYRGYIKLMVRGGAYRQIESELVYKGEPFTDERGLDRTFRHVPDYEKDRESLEGLRLAYCVMRPADGGPAHVECVPVSKILRIQKTSLDKIEDAGKREQSPWMQWAGSMARKTAVRAGAKYASLAAEDRELLERVIEVDYAAEREVRGERVDLSAVKAPSKMVEEARSLAADSGNGVALEAQRGQEAGPAPVRRDGEDDAVAKDRRKEIDPLAIRVNETYAEASQCAADTEAVWKEMEAHRAAGKCPDVKWQQAAKAKLPESAHAEFAEMVAALQRGAKGGK